MTLTQLIAQTQMERAKAVAQVRADDARMIQAASDFVVAMDRINAALLRVASDSLLEQSWGR